MCIRDSIAVYGRCAAGCGRRSSGGAGCAAAGGQCGCHTCLLYTSDGTADKSGEGEIQEFASEFQ